MVGTLIPLDEVVHFDACTHSPSTGGVSDADSTPTYSVFEEATDTPILSAQSFTKRTSLTGDYRGSFTASAANGFETGKWYNIIASATVGGVTGKKVCGTFRVAPAETTAGQPLVDVPALTATIADSIPAVGTRPSIAQALYMINQFLTSRLVSGQQMTIRKADGSNTLFVITLNDATTPTSYNRTT